MRKYFKTGIALLAFTNIFISCDSGTDQPDTFVFPLEIGNYWQYDRSVLITNIRPDSLINQFDPEYHSTLDGEITRNVTLPNGTGVEYFLVETDSSQIIPTWDYYQNLQEGMFLLGYKNAGAPSAPKNNRKYFIRFKGKTFSAIDELVQYVSSGFYPVKQKQDSIILESQKPMVLKYPLQKNSTWTFRTRGNPFQIDKVIENREITDVPAGNFNCYKVRWKYDIDNDGTLDDNIRLYDYYAPEGLVKRLIEIDNIPYFSIDGDSVGTNDYREEYLLTNYGKR